MSYLSSQSFGLENDSDEENIGDDDEARECPDKDVVAIEIDILLFLILPFPHVGVVNGHCCHIHCGRCLEQTTYSNQLRLGFEKF
jgi:hypothetical protein